MTLLQVRDLKVQFSSRKGLGHPAAASTVRAVDGVDLEIGRGESLGIVVESGCGKSTLARSIAGLIAPTSGEILLDGAPLPAKRDRATCRKIQMVFQDPASSLNPQRTIGRTLEQLLLVNELAQGATARQRVSELLDMVQLSRSTADQYPRRLSGGQRQRAAIARALALQPEIVVADEPVAALDVSVQAAILNLLNDLRRDLGLTLLFISHDLGVVQHVCDRVAVLYLGRIVEQTDQRTVFDQPRHPYTQALIRAVPIINGDQLPGRSALPGDPPSPANRPAGCAFRQRCPVAIERCAVDDPVLRGEASHPVACHVVNSSA